MATLEDNLRNLLRDRYPEDKGFTFEVEGVGQAMSPVKVTIFDKNGGVVKSASSTLSYDEFVSKL